MRLVDAEGHAYTMGGITTGGNDQKMEYRYNFNRFGGEARIGQPAKLIWDIPIETKEVAVPIEFRDLPIP